MTQVTVPRVSVAAIKKYDAMVLEVASEKIKVKLGPLVEQMGEAEKERTMQVIEIVMTEMATAIQAMETARGIR
jgi:hypothetical protein